MSNREMTTLLPEARWRNTGRPLFSPRSGLPKINVLSLEDNKGVSTLKSHRRRSFFSLSEVYHHLTTTARWRDVLIACFVLYLSVLLTFSAAYYVISLLCGSSATFITALYMNVVTIAANGGYFGEDPAMLDPSHGTCFRYRTWLVLLGSYANVIITGLLGATFVTKATTPQSLRKRMMFSDYCALTRGTTSGLQFRIGNLHAHDISHAHLKVFLVVFTNAEDLDDGTTSVTSRVHELSWGCDEESMSTTGALLLWFPATILIPIQQAPLQQFFGEDSTGAVPTSTFQLVAVFEGDDGTTGAPISIKHTYLPSAIQRRYKFSPLRIGLASGGRYVVDYSTFNELEAEDSHY